MAQQRKPENGNGAIVGGAATAAYGVGTAPIIRAGTKDPSKMISASPKKQPVRYQAELHNAMKAGKVETDSPVRVLRTPSGRHLNAGGTHRHIARQAMGKPSHYEIKDIDSEVHLAPVQVAANKFKMAQLKRGSKRAEEGKKVKPVGAWQRNVNRGMAEAADHADDAIWHSPSRFVDQAKFARKAGLIGGAAITAAGVGVMGHGIKEHHDYKKQSVRKSNVSAFGIEH